MMNGRMTIWLIVLAYVSSVNAEILYNLIDLGTGIAWSVNNNGQAVGTSWPHFGAALFDTTGSGSNVKLGTNFTHAWAINENGKIVGYEEIGSPSTHHAMLFDSTGNYANNIDLTPSVSMYPSYARGINIHGQIVGEESYEAVLFDATGSGNNLFLGAGAAHSINDYGQIVGYNGTQAMIFDPTGQQQNNVYLGTLGGERSTARSINNTGQIVGYAAAVLTKSQQQLRATLFDPTGGGNNVDLGTSGFQQSDALSINNHGQIVGILGYEEKAALFDSTGSGNNIILNNLIDPALGWDLRRANSINDNGWIVGYGYNSEGIQRAFLLTPIPEPCTLLMLAVGGMILRRKR